MQGLSRFILMNAFAVAVVSVVIGLTGQDPFSRNGASAAERGFDDPFAPKPALAPAYGATLPPGYVQLGARVLAEPASDLILPGDRVHLTGGPGGDTLLADLKILAIDPPLGADDRLYVTFSLPAEKSEALRSLRETTLLYLRLVSPGPGHHAAAFEPLRPGEVITRRYRPDDWQHRLQAR